MKILWIINIVPPRISSMLEMETTSFGGWLTGYLENLKGSRNEYFVICLDNKVEKILTATDENITYFVFPQKLLIQSEFEKIIEGINPDIIHVHGTEYPHSLEMAKAAKKFKVKTVVSIQGLMSECEKHYFDGIPPKFKKCRTLKRIAKSVLKVVNLQPQFLIFEVNRFTEGAKLEAETLNAVDYVIGRSDWDKKYSNLINNNLKYYKVHEILREEFYTNKVWSYDNCQKHSIFISQASYPIKGLHIFLDALNIVVKRYPDTKVYLAGSTPLVKSRFSFLTKILTNLYDYPKILAQKINKHNIESHLIFMGLLDANAMKKAYLESNVFVSPSSIENGSNSVSEAMMLHVPVISSEVGGVDSVFRYGIDGLSYKFEDYHTLADNIIKIFELEENVEIYTNPAKEFAIKTKSIENNIQDLLNAYEDILLQ